MKEVGADDSFDRQDIKSKPINSAQLEELYKMTGSYEALFNRRSRQYNARELKDKELTEEDFRDLILEEYTFLKRPVFINDGKAYIGNAKAIVNDLRESLHGG